jgi:hypothetical protein
MFSRTLLNVTLAAGLIAGVSGCGSHAGNGALIGGATGAGIGAIAGHNTGSGHTAGGALIGGAIGSLVGAAVGSEADAAERRKSHRQYDRRYYERDDYRDYRHAPPPPVRYERYESRRYDPHCDDGYYEYRSYRSYRSYGQHGGSYYETRRHGY